MNILIGLAISFLLFAFIITRKIKLILKIFFLVLLVVIILISSTYLTIFGVNTRGLEDLKWYEITPWKHIILFACMLLGMITNYFYDYIQTRIKYKEAIEKGNEKVVLPKFMWEKLILPILISVLLFGYFWGEYSKENISLMVIFASYQNGFFWQTILAKITQK